MEVVETQRRIWRKWNDCPFLPNDPINPEIPLDYTPSEWEYTEEIGESWHDFCTEVDRVRRRFWKQPEKNEKSPTPK